MPGRGLRTRRQDSGSPEQTRQPLPTYRFRRNLFKIPDIMTASIFYFLSSLPIIALAALRLRRHFGIGWTVFLLLAMAYGAFSLTAWGRMAGFIPTVSVTDMISQIGYDCGRLPLPVDTLLSVAFWLGTLFNAASAVCLWYRVKLWQWIAGCIVAFCCVACLGSVFVPISPIAALFGACCGFMVVVGWVMGLSYIQVCVIGNIWLQCVMISAAAGWLIYRASSKLSFSRLLAIGFGTCQIILSLAVFVHYQGTMHEAFYRCVDDLNRIAAMTCSTYIAVNIYIYVIGWPLIIAVDWLWGRMLLGRPHSQPVCKA